MKFGFTAVTNILRTRHEPESLHAFADFFWHTLVISCITLAILMTAYNAWAYLDILAAVSNKPSASAPASEKPPFDRAKLDMVAEGLLSRHERYQQLSTSASAVADPSR